MKKIFACFAACIILGFSTTKAEDVYNPIASSVYSLGISADAVASGMGDIGAATKPDVYSQ